MNVMKLLPALGVAITWSQLSATEAINATDRELGEVIVHGSQVRLYELRKAAVDAEDRFYSRYNELNAVDDFAVECRDEAPTGSQLRRRKCLARYEVQAHREEGFEAFKIRQFVQHNPRIMPASPPVSASVTIEARRPDFQRNMRDTLYRNPELIQMLIDREEAIARFNAAKRAPGSRDDKKVAADEEAVE